MSEENTGRLALVATDAAVRLRRMARDESVPRAALARAAEDYVEKTKEIRMTLARVRVDTGVSLESGYEANDAVSALLKLYVDETQRGLRAIMAVCESPIESLFLAAWLSPVKGYETAVPPDLHAALGDLAEVPRSYTRLWCHLTASETQVAPKLSTQGKPHAYSRSPVPLWIVPQYDLVADGRTARVDFAIIPAEGSGCPCMAVELDGHQWHERTPQQAASDKSRDRALKAAGWTTLRFTGSEVKREPGACVDQVRHAALWDTWRSNRSKGAAE